MLIALSTGKQSFLTMHASICSLTHHAFNLTSISWYTQETLWYQDSLQTPESSDASVLYTEWHSLCMQSMVLTFFTLPLDYTQFLTRSKRCVIHCCTHTFLTFLFLWQKTQSKQPSNEKGGLAPSSRDFSPRSAGSSILGPKVGQYISHVWSMQQSKAGYIMVLLVI